jgi:hypothetical protein
VRSDRHQRLRSLVVAIALASTVSSLSWGGALPAGAAVSAGPDAAGVTWLCRPGLANDPCLYPETATSLSANGLRSVVQARPASNPPFDCFYAYPTVELSARTANAPAVVTPLEQAVAVSQASRFAQVCNLWAPTYRQRTAASLEKGLGADPHADLVSYHSFLAGWKDYLAHDNHGRPVIFIGHSQGAANLIRLLRSQVDNNPALRARMVMAIILGGNVQVPDSRGAGGTFAHIPACTAGGQTGCVVAYSSFSMVPPPDALFGRPGTGVSLQSGQRKSSGEHVLCTNPAALGSQATLPLTPYFARFKKTGTSWVTYPGLYTGRCMSKDGATWLQVTAAAGDPRPIVKVDPSLGPSWGLHSDDVNLALGNLVADVTAAEAAFTARRQ